jgi:DNA-binding beta-propeller fold protein YncE
MIGKRGFGALLLVALHALACPPPMPAYRDALRDEGEIHLYLQPLPARAHRLDFRIAAIDAIPDHGEPVPLGTVLAEVSGRQLVGVQKRLAWGVAPPGSYRGLSIQIGKASLRGEEGSADLALPEEPVLVEQPFTVARKQASALFLSLDPEGLVTSGFRFTPVFHLAGPRQQLRGLLGFATHTGRNLVSVFNKHTMRVVDIIATGRGPMGAAIDPRRAWVYVALAGDDAIEAIEVNTGEILRRLELNFGDEPVEIALSPGGSLLVSANRGSNTASIIDAVSLRELDRVALPSEPTWVVVGGGTAPRAYLIQPISNALTAVDLSRREVAATRILDESPVRAALSRDGSSLYVITRHSSDLLVIDAASLALSGRIYVGAGATSVRADPQTGLIYVGKSAGGISVVDPTSLLPIDRFRLDGDAAYLAIDDDENSLFVVLPELRAVRKLNLVSKRGEGEIDVAEGAYAVVLMGER